MLTLFSNFNIFRMKFISYTLSNLIIYVYHDKIELLFSANFVFHIFSLKIKPFFQSLKSYFLISNFKSYISIFQFANSTLNKELLYVYSNNVQGRTWPLLLSFVENIAGAVDMTYTMPWIDKQELLDHYSLRVGPGRYYYPL